MSDCRHACFVAHLFSRRKGRGKLRRLIDCICIIGPLRLGRVSVTDTKTPHEITLILYLLPSWSSRSVILLYIFTSGH
jgi:hypothetical protein